MTRYVGSLREVARAIAAVVALLCSAAALRAQANSPVDIYRALESADSTYEAGDRPAAIAAYQRVVEHDSAHARALYRLGRSYESAGRLEDAIAALERSRAIGYRFSWWIARQIAIHYARLGERNLALEWLETSLAEGLEDRAAIAANPGFEPLAGEPRFERLAGAIPDSLERVAGWRHDLRYFVAEARRLHAGPGRHAWSDRFEALADSIYDRIPALADAEVVLELQRLGVLLGDGHTGVYSTSGNLAVRFPRLPVVFYWFQDGLHVVDGEGQGEALVGSRVVRIGELDPDEALRRLDPYIPRDNEMTPLWLGVHFYFPSGRHLAAVGIVDEPGRVSMTVETPAGAERRVTLRTGDHAFARKLRHPPSAAVAAPAWLRDVDTPYRVVPLPDLGAIYVPFNQVRDAEVGPTLSAFADSLRHALERTDAAHLIVDVRHNNGGDSGLLPPLVRTMVWWEEESPEHRIWMVTGRNTFSAAQQFINHVERWTDAVFVGERSSSRPNHSGESTALVLPWSGVRGSISSRYFQDSDPLDGRQWIDVDLRAPLAAEDYFAGRDPVMEAIAEVIESSH